MSGRDDKTKGKLDEIKGNVKENIGNAAGDDDLSREG
nr:CsbD family protein [Chloroflexia bacterium]